MEAESRIDVDDVLTESLASYAVPKWLCTLFVLFLGDNKYVVVVVEGKLVESVPL